MLHSYVWPYDSLPLILYTRLPVRTNKTGQITTLGGTVGIWSHNHKWSCLELSIEGSVQQSKIDSKCHLEGAYLLHAAHFSSVFRGTHRFRCSFHASVTFNWNGLIHIVPRKHLLTLLSWVILKIGCKVFSIWWFYIPRRKNRIRNNVLQAISHEYILLSTIQMEISLSLRMSD